MSTLLTRYLAANVRLQEARFDEDTGLEDTILKEMAELWSGMSPEEQQEAERRTAQEE